MKYCKIISEKDHIYITIVITLKQKKRGRDLLFVSSLFKCPHNPSWARLKPGTRNSVSVSHVGDRLPTVSITTYCPVGRALAGSWKLKPRYSDIEDS